MHMTRVGVLSLLALALGGCVSTTAPTTVHQPMSARPQPPSGYMPNNGAIYQVSRVRPLFEDRRARLVGDTLTINISENTSAQKQSSTSADRSHSTDFSVGAVVGLPGKSFQNAELGADHETEFEGSGDSAANNVFTGTITVTVIEVLPNGNLLVSGEKQLAINQGNEFIRFSGVVNPVHITTSNTVQSTQVADARMEYRGSGFIDSAQVMGWMGRFFLSVLPF